MTLVNYAKWVDVLMHIHIGVMGKSVSVKVVSWYCVRLKLCVKAVTLVNYAKWVDVLMHIHIGTMGKSVNVKVVHQLANMHTATTCFILQPFFDRRCGK